MANTFKRKVSKSVGTSAATIYTVPASTTATAIGLAVANTSASDITVDVYLTISAVDYYLLKSAPVPVGGAVVAIGGDQKVVMETGDILKVISSAATIADVVLSILEIA